MNRHITSKSNTRGFTLVELIVVIGIILMLLALFFPATRGAREPARRNNCSNQMRQLTLSNLNFESAHQHLPLAMRGAAAPSITVHGPAPFAADDGYSYLVSLLAYAEEVALSDQIIAASNGLTEPINSSVFNETGTPNYIWDQPVELLICPSFPGENLALGDYSPVQRPQVSNYHAMVAGCVRGAEQRFADLDPETGGAIVTQQASDKGIMLEEIQDGTSRTILLTESRGEVWVAWFSGVSTATVAIPPDVARCEPLLQQRGADGYRSFSNLPAGLNYGSRLHHRTNKEASLFWASRSDQREWGPSSVHTGGVVMTGYVDGHVKALSDKIDATTYFRLSTRGGGEPADDG